ncbi:MAG: hypothetical protein DRG24_05320 [Epsilonproteobacteria bacterium]|nr:MAG: hypothetical protein DRG24_05320 [Campylobacterota bacterium]
MKQTWIHSLLILLIITIFSACEEKPTIKHSGKTVEIGVIVPLSGEHVSLGVKALIGLNAAHALQPLTVTGDRIQLHIGDNNSSIKGSLSLLEKFAENTDIKAIIILLNSYGALSIKQMINKKKIPVIAAIATHETLTTQSNYITRVSSSNDTQGKMAAFFAHDELLINRVAVFYDADSVYSTSLAQFFKEEFTDIGGTVYDELTANMPADQLERRLRALQEKGVELIYTSAIKRNAIHLLQINKKFNLNFQFIGTGNMLANMKERGITDYTELSEGTFVVAEYFDDRIKSIIEQQMRRYAKKKAIEFNTHSLLAYDSYLLLRDALKNCAECSRSTLNEALRNNRGFAGISDTIRTKDGDVKRPMFINKIHNEKMYVYVKVF